jgi:hypothetical protein
MSDDDPSASTTKLLAFPQARVRPPQNPGGFADLGISILAQRMGLPQRQGTGHWCSRCQGIWYGYLLEVDCPRCGSRQG